MWGDIKVVLIVGYASSITGLQEKQSVSKAM